MIVWLAVKGVIEILRLGVVKSYCVFMIGTRIDCWPDCCGYWVVEVISPLFSQRCLMTYM